LFLVYWQKRVVQQIKFDPFKLLYIHFLCLCRQQKNHEKQGSQYYLSTHNSHFTVAIAVFPGFVIEIFPPHIHKHLLLSVSADIFITFTCALPGAHGAVTAGTQGIGVSTPIAADVAEATAGLDKD
jgi:hypothetical protein